MPTAKTIESELQALRDRRPNLAAERDEAAAAVRQARNKLVNGDAEDTDAVKEAQTDYQALQGSLEAMDTEIAQKETALQQARAEEAREEAISALVALSGEAADQRAAYYEKRQQLVEDFEERLGALAEAEAEWRETFKEFTKRARGLAPAVREGLAPIKDKEEHASRERERDQLVQELQAKGADLDAAVPRLFKNQGPSHIHYTIGEGRFEPEDKALWGFQDVIRALRRYQSNPPSNS